MSTNKTWPKVAVEYWGKPKAHEVMTREVAAERFGIPLNSFEWLDDPYCSGCGINRTESPKAAEVVRMFHTYTSDEAVRDAAQEMLKVLRNVLGQLDLMPDDVGSISMFNTTRTGKPTKAALAIREGLRAEMQAVITKATT